MKPLHFFKQWFSKKDKPTFKNVVYVQSLADVPQKTESDIFVVSESGINKWVVFQCPNKCGKRVEVNLMRSRYPYWTVKIRKKKVSLYPSVVVQDCGAHFWLTDSKVLDAVFYSEE